MVKFDIFTDDGTCFFAVITVGEIDEQFIVVKVGIPIGRVFGDCSGRFAVVVRNYLFGQQGAYAVQCAWHLDTQPGDW